MAATRGVPIQLDKKRHVRFSMNALQEISRDSGIVEILTLGLRHEDPEITEEQVGEMVDLEMFPELTEVMKKASGGLIDLEKLFAEAQEEAPAEGKPPARKTRKKSRAKRS